MGTVLQVYSPKAYREYLLPAINNTETVLVIEKACFQLQEDVLLKLEVVDGLWRFLPSDGVKLNAKEKEDDGGFLRDGAVFELETEAGARLTLFVEEQESSFAVYEKYVFSQANPVTIGTNEENIIKYGFQDIVSRRHAVISKTGSAAQIEDCSSNGVFVNYRRISGKVRLNFGDSIHIFGLNIVYLGEILAVRHTKQLRLDTDRLKPCVKIPVSPAGGERGKVLYHRPPRHQEKLETAPVEIEAPPAPKAEPNTPLFMLIGPAMTMAIPMLLGSGISIIGSRMSGSASSAFMYTGLITAVTSALIGVFWALTNVRYARKTVRKEELHRLDAYSGYLKKMDMEIRERYQHNAQALHAMYPAPTQLMSEMGGALQLWTRNSNHADFLNHRLGLGDIPFQAEIRIPKERFMLWEDSLADNPRLIKENYAVLREVPVCVDLKNHRLIGAVGKQGGARSVLYSLIAQLALNNCYTDVKMVFLYNEARRDEAESWEFAKWFPHVWSADRKVRFVAANKAEAGEVLYELARILRERKEEKGISDREQTYKPHYIVFVSDPGLLADEPAAKYLLDAKESLGVTCILMAERCEELPNACEWVIEKDENFCGMYDVAAGEEERQRIAFDQVDRPSLEALARKLSNYEVNETEAGGEIPSSLSFLDMYGVDTIQGLNVPERWKKHRTIQSMRALLGQKSGGADCYLDIHEKYHGPHGLVAGTTGSGKSETLQTYILSLAINYSPDDIGFFLIDYKGGGMGNLFTNLPHMLGQISNLSGNQVRRAMVSIKSENRRRQRIFNDHGVNNINLYTAMYKNGEASVPVPHLFIIIDEFAELKREEPDFMKELISVAQVGRSLGVHLILSTQKPSGTVDDNIWSNSRFRLCLRVQDKQDSMDMLHRPDAAYLTQAGRGYLQVGNDELFELFQSGWSGAIYDSNGNQRRVIAMMLDHTGKTALIGNHAKLLIKEEERLTWITHLMELLQELDGRIEAVFDRLEEEKAGLERNDFNRKRLQSLQELAEMAESKGFDSMRERAAFCISYAAERAIRLPELKERTQLDAIVEYLAQTAVQCGYEKGQMLWLPVLPTSLIWEQIAGKTFDGGKWPEYGKRWELAVPIGLVDDPVHQAQLPLWVNFTQGGHLAICGMATSGKSTFLQTLAYALVNSYSPEYVNIYAMDFGSHMLSAFEEEAHFGGIMYENDSDKLGKFFYLLAQMLEERKAAFGGGNYSQYVMTHGQEYPAVVIMIDNYANFREKTEDRYSDRIIRIAREGAGYGIYLVITAAGYGSMEIPGRLADNIRTAFCLEMNDKLAYGDVLKTYQLTTLPEINVKGRGLAMVDGKALEFQAAISLEAEDDYQRSEKIRAEAQRMDSVWQGRRARQVPVIPEKPVWQELEKTDEYQTYIRGGRYFPIGYNRETAGVYAVDLCYQLCFLISGRARTGKTNLLKGMIRTAGAMGGKVAVFDTASGELFAAAKEAGARYLTSRKEQFAFFSEMIPDLKERTQIKQQGRRDGCSEEEIYERMKEMQKYFLIIADLPSFVREAYAAEKQVEYHGFVEMLTQKGALHNIYFIAAMNPDDREQTVGKAIYENFVKEKKGIHLGGNLDKQRFFGFDDVPYSERGKVTKAGNALVPADEEHGTVSVVIPFVANQKQEETGC